MLSERRCRERAGQDGQLKGRAAKWRRPDRTCDGTDADIDRGHVCAYGSWRSAAQAGARGTMGRGDAEPSQCAGRKEGNARKTGMERMHGTCDPCTRPLFYRCVETCSRALCMGERPLCGRTGRGLSRGDAAKHGEPRCVALSLNVRYTLTMCVHAACLNAHLNGEHGVTDRWAGCRATRPDGPFGGPKPQQFRSRQAHYVRA